VVGWAEGPAGAVMVKGERAMVVWVGRSVPGGWRLAQPVFQQAFSKKYFR